MEIKLDTVDFKEVFNAAIIKTLDEEKKNALIQGALNHLTTRPDNNGYRKGKTPIEDAFEMALNQVAREKIEEFLKTDESINKTIEKLISDAVSKINGDRRENTVSKIADKIIEGLYSDKY